MASSLLLVLSTLLAVARCQSSDVYATNYGGFSGPYAWTNQPPPREGTVYGNNAASNYVYFAGGVELISASQPNAAYTDVWTIDVAGQQFVKASATLPSGSYFGVGGWGYKTNTLWVHTGRNNTDTSANTYWTGLVGLAVSASAPTQLALSSYPLFRALDGRQYASSLIFTPKSTGVETMFVYGGLTGGDGYGIPAINFYSIALQGAVGAVTPLSQTGSVPMTYSGTAVTSNPTMFLNPATMDHVYFLGGLDSSGDNFGLPGTLYIYQASTNAWLAPTSVARSSYSAVPFNPYIVYSGTIITADFTQVLLIGGDWGLGNTTDSELNGTHNAVFHIDCTPLTAANPSAQPYLAQLSYRLPYRVESPVSALVGNTTILSWSGSQYETTTQPACTPTLVAASALARLQQHTHSPLCAPVLPLPSVSGQYLNEEQNDAAAYVSGVVLATQTGGNNGGASSATASVLSAVGTVALGVAAVLL